MNQPAGRRLIGIDLARGLAMFGMVTTHYVWPTTAPPDEGLLVAPVALFDGRAMPLFMLLGGVGLTFLSRRPTGADRALLIRAVLLFWLGMALNLATETIAVVLQFYGVLFLFGPVWRRLPSWVLLAGAGLVTGLGGWTFQAFGDHRQHLTWWALTDGRAGVESLFVRGYYPFFPVFAFFAVGVVLGRVRLGQRSVAWALAVGGAALGFGTLLLARAALFITGSTVEPADPVGAESGSDFRWARLLDTAGHSEMPAWVLSATGTSVMVLGLCLLVADGVRSPRPTDEGHNLLTRSIATVGMMSLTFYAFQILTSRPLPSPYLTSSAREWFHVLALYGGFTVFALGWRRWVGPGPLEWLLRVGSRRKSGTGDRRPDPVVITSHR